MHDSKDSKKEIICLPNMQIRYVRKRSLSMTGVRAEDFFKIRKKFKPQGQNMW